MTKQNDTDLLRFVTIGSVDDGKSTLIGRLLYDSKAILEDQLAAVKRSSKTLGEDFVNLALLTDGLRAEREQGITIDVAYRYFATPKRKFIIADTPGHIQYTRNMVTGASTSNLAVVLIDARKGITEQTCRHIFIVSLLRIQHLIICINKMDLVQFKQKTFDKIVGQIKNFASRLEVPDIRFIPTCALHGDNIVKKSSRMPWHKGQPLLPTLETIYIGNDSNHVDPRFPVQHVIRPQTNHHHDFRGFAGLIASGVFKPGDEVMILPSKHTTRIAAIYDYNKKIKEAFWPMSVVMTLKDEIDISRGDMIARPHNLPQKNQDLELMICWFHKEPLNPNAKYTLRHTTRETKCLIKNIRYKLNVRTLHRMEKDKKISLNDIARIQIRTSHPLFFDPYKRNRNTGSVILIDEFTNQTLASGMIL